jgi:hypothetical protein
MKEQSRPPVFDAMKAKVGRDDANQIALHLLLNFDMAERGLGDERCAHVLAKHLLIALAIGERSNIKALHEAAGDGYEALEKVCKRQTEFLAFTMRDYRAIRRAVVAYLQVLPNVAVGLMYLANKRALEALGVANVMAAYEKVAA